MRGIRALTALLVAAIIAGAGAALAAGSAGRATVSLAHNAALGSILASASGRTLYETTRDRHDVATCTGACAKQWSPLLSATRRLVAGAGVDAALLGTIARPGGVLQVTYRGLPLYLYRGDTRAGQANGEGVDGVWHAVAPSGAAVTTPASSTAHSSATSAAGTGSPATGSSSGTDSGMGAGTSTQPAAGSPGVGMWCAANPSDCVNGVPVTGG